MCIIYHSHILFVWCEMYRIDGFMYVWASAFSWPFRGEKVFSQQYLLRGRGSPLGPLEKHRRTRILGGMRPLHSCRREDADRCLPPWHWTHLSPPTELNRIISGKLSAAKKKIPPYWASISQKGAEIWCLSPPRVLTWAWFSAHPS